MVEDLREKETEDTMRQLTQVMSSREASRRVGNNFLKPLSEVDLSQFAQQDRATPSYYHLPRTFPTPVCSGR